MTNGDKIRAMDVKNLPSGPAVRTDLRESCARKKISCRDCSLKWVKQKAEETDGKESQTQAEKQR